MMDLHILYLINPTFTVIFVRFAAFSDLLRHSSSALSMKTHVCSSAFHTVIDTHA